MRGTQAGSLRSGDVRLRVSQFPSPPQRQGPALDRKYRKKSQPGQCAHLVPLGDDFQHDSSPRSGTPSSSATSGSSDFLNSQP